MNADDIKELIFLSTVCAVFLMFMGALCYNLIRRDL